MWQVVANNRNGEYFTKSELTLEESREIHSLLSNSGQWAVVRSLDTEYYSEKKTQNVGT
jgi:hypothetical protein